MDDAGYAAETALRIIDVMLHQGYVAIPVQPKRYDDDEIPFASHVPRSVRGTRIPPRYSTQLNIQLM